MGFKHGGKNYICQGRIVAQEKYKGLFSAHPISSLRTSSFIKNIVRSMVPTSIMASWEAEDTRAKEKKEGNRLSVGTDASGCLQGAARREARVGGKPQEGSSQESASGNPCGSWTSQRLLWSWIIF